MNFRWSKILTSTILIVAYSIVIYKLLSYDDYESLFFYLKNNNGSNWHLILLAILLMPANIFIESIKWRYAISNIEQVSIRDAVRATLIGQVGSIATPNKLGDFPTRSLILKSGNKANATILGFISAWTLPFVIIIIGLFSSYFYISTYNNISITINYVVVASLCSVIILCCLFSIPKISNLLSRKEGVASKIKDTLTVLSSISSKQLLILTLLSLLRYAIFCTQFYLMLRFFNVNISLYEALLTIPTIYLLTTVTPSTLASEAATRSSYAIFILAPFSTTAPTITIAATLLWCLNNGIPLILGLLSFNSKIIKF